MLAAERVGAANWSRLVDEHKGKGRPRYVPTPIHNEIVAALNDDRDDDAAMSLLHTYDYRKEVGL
jgi:hypothetical protein